MNNGFNMKLCLVSFIVFLIALNCPSQAATSDDASLQRLKSWFTQASDISITGSILKPDYHPKEPVGLYDDRLDFRARFSNTQVINAFQQAVLSLPWELHKNTADDELLFNGEVQFDAEFLLQVIITFKDHSIHKFLIVGPQLLWIQELHQQFSLSGEQKLSFWPFIRNHAGLFDNITVADYIGHKGDPELKIGPRRTP